MRVRTGSGHVLSVQARMLGSALDGDQSSGVTSLTVQDCADFDDQIGGSLTLNGATYTYSSVDDDAGTVAISPALVASALDGDVLVLLDPVNGAPQSEWTAEVTVDGEDPGDTIEASIEGGLLDRLHEGIRGIAGEGVTLQWDENGEVSVIGLPGSMTSQSVVQGWATDSLTVFESGDQTLRLSYRPLDQTEHLRWCGASQPYDAFTRDDYVVTIPDPDGVLDAGDTLTMQYLYTDPTPRPVIPATMTLIGTGHVDAGTSSIALPAGTLEGDLIMLGIASHANTACDCSDSRMRVAHAAISPITSNNSSVWIGYGYADASGSAVPFTLAAPIGGSSARVMIATLRITGGLNVAYTALRSVDGDGGSFIPALPVGDMGVVMLLAHSGTVASDFNPEATGTWTMVGGTDSGRTVGEVTRLCTAAGDPSAGGQWAGISSGGYWTALAIGLAGV